MNVVLIGYRGTGKTAIGKLLAKKLGLKFADSDALIVEKAGKSIVKIFEDDGDARFRELEAEAIKELSQRDNHAIATGGGAPMRAENVENLKKKGIVILLEASAEKIYQRIKNDKGRPSLTGKELKEEIKELLAKRKPVYEKAADFRIRTDAGSVKKNVDDIISYLGKRGFKK